MTAADPSLRRLSYPLKPRPFSEPSDFYLLPLSAISTSGTGSAQFFASVFEAATADYCLARSESLKFSPTYTVKGRDKNPEFELTTKIGKVVCECKSLSEGDRQYRRRLATLSQALDSAAKGLGGVPEGYRLEVHIRGPVRGNLGKLARQVCKTAFECSADVKKRSRQGYSSSA